jgi:hypothetical protein
LLGCSADDSEDVCNTLTNSGPPVTPQIVSSGTTPEGGRIEDGTYEQTALDYRADPGETLEPDERTFSSIFVFEAGSVEMVIGKTLGGIWDEERYSATYATSGTEITFRYTCPDDGTIERPEYTATETGLRLYYRIVDDTATAEVTLTKR